jgi:hypothetical protein
MKLFWVHVTFNAACTIFDFHWYTSELFCYWYLFNSNSPFIVFFIPFYCHLIHICLGISAMPSAGYLYVQYYHYHNSMNALTISAFLSKLLSISPLLCSSFVFPTPFTAYSPYFCRRRLSITCSSASIAFRLLLSLTTIEHNSLNRITPSSLQPPYSAHQKEHFVNYVIIC